MLADSRYMREIPGPFVYYKTLIATAMDNSRRNFVGAGLVIAVAAVSSEAASRSQRPRLGLVVHTNEKTTPDEALATVKRFGLSTCQLAVGMAPPELAAPIRNAVAKHEVTITALMTLGEGPMVWNLRDGPKTIGIIPPKTRAERVAALKRASELAKACGISAVHTHCGFIPENPNEPLYAESVAAIKEVATHLRNNGQNFLMETGQETPITLKRVINDVGIANLAVNLDVANLILYGKGEPVGALDVIGKYVRGMHAKDGLYPQDPYGLGQEVPIGKGRVRFPEVFEALRRLNYDGAITIEREISGPQQERDIAASKVYLEELIEQTWS